jgi:integrase/recombinase XerD
MLLNGANPKSVMLQLGHKKVETTYKYLQLSKANNQKIYRKHFLKEKKEK